MRTRTPTFAATLSRRLSFRAGRALAGAVLAAAALPGVLPAQGDPAAATVFVNGEAERYLRLMQLAGEAPLRPWSVRGFAPAEVDALLPADPAHPWADRAPFRGRGGVAAWVPPEVRAVYNSTFAYGGNDGAVWAGRGATVALSGGVAVRRGAFSAALAPVAFWAQNADFAVLAPASDPESLGDPRGRPMDLPQRFGTGAYARLDAGESGARVDAGPLTAGVSNAHQQWGPAVLYPLLLGSNAPGFAHAFAGTHRPLRVGVGRLHARVTWGALEQTEYSPAADSLGRRFASGLALVFTPAGIPGLEVGGASFVHAPWLDGPGVAEFLQPLTGLFSSGRDRADTTAALGRPENQIASVFARWVFPRAGMEVYGEFGREDRAFDLRNLLLEPDHVAAYVLGFQKVLRRGPRRLSSVRGEWFSSEPSHLHLTDVRSPFYTHAELRQGHTHRGQLLGAAAGHGGAAWVAALDVYDPRGRWTASLGREQRRSPPGYPTAVVGESGPDAQVFAGVEALRFTGPLEVQAELRGVYELNRDFGGDAFNLHLALGLRARL